MSNHNPFLYGNPVSSEHFIGRKNELRRIVGRINKGESTSITGPFRCGKTSVLQYISNSKQLDSLYGKESNKLIFSYLDVGALGIEINQSQFWDNALEKLQNHINTNNVSSSLSEAYNTCKNNQFANFFLEKLIEEIKKDNLCLVLMLDVFDNVLYHKVLNSTEFFGGLRGLASLSQGALALVITGNTSLTELNNQTQNFNRTGSAYFNFMDEIILGALQDNEVSKLLQLGNKHFKEHDKEFIIRIAGKHPYLLQTAASLLWDSYEDADKDEEQRVKYVVKEFNIKIIDKFACSWKSWSLDMLKVFTSVALMQMDSIDNLPETPTRIRLDNNKLIHNIKHLLQELNVLERYGFLTKDKSIGGGWKISSEILLHFVAAKLQQESGVTTLDNASYEKWLKSQHGQVMASSADILERISTTVLTSFFGGVTKAILKS